MRFEIQTNGLARKWEGKTAWFVLLLLELLSWLLMTWSKTRTSKWFSQSQHTMCYSTPTGLPSSLPDYRKLFQVFRIMVHGTSHSEGWDSIKCHLTSSGLMQMYIFKDILLKLKQTELFFFSRKNKTWNSIPRQQSHPHPTENHISPQRNIVL